MSSKIKIKRKYLGDIFLYYVFLEYGSTACIVRQACVDEKHQAFISDDLKYIEVLDGLVISSIHGEYSKKIYRLKVPPKYLSHVRENILS